MKIVSLAAVYMMLGVACGAFGAHALKDTLSPHDMAIWEKAVLYQLIHALAALVLALWPVGDPSNRGKMLVSWLMLGSVTVFSGSLYILVLSGKRWLGMITPLGGVGFMLAWLLLAVRAWRCNRPL